MTCRDVLRSWAVLGPFSRYLSLSGSICLEAACGWFESARIEPLGVRVPLSCNRRSQGAAARRAREPEPWFQLKRSACASSPRAVSKIRPETRRAGLRRLEEDARIVDRLVHLGNEGMASGIDESFDIDTFI